MKSRLLLLAVSLLVMRVGAVAGADTQEVLRLYPGPAPGTEDWTQEEKQFDSPLAKAQIVTNVTQPTITAYLPDPAKATGAAVIVAPGGGFHFLSIESEGVDVAKWFNERGVAAFVLRYRLVPTGDDMAAVLMKKLSDMDAFEKEVAPFVPIAGADGLAAVRCVRENAEKFGVAPDRVGFIGFSAGGAVTAYVATHYDPESRPSFVAPIYGGAGEFKKAIVPDDAPPLFIVAASDDQLVPPSESIALYSKWVDAGKPAEMHIYAHGGHGFGMNQQELPVDMWIDRLYEWISAEGLLTGAAADTQAIDLSGTWSVHVDSSLGTGIATFQFEQAGERLKGQYDGIFGQLPFTGEIHGNEVAFSFVTNATGQDELISYYGTVAEKDLMKGEIQLGDQGSGTFEGYRK